MKISGLMITVIIGILGGIAVGVQSPIASAMGKQVGSAAGSFILHVSGAAFSLVLLLLRGGEQIQTWRNLPFYMLGAGILGLVFLLTLRQTMPQLGATTAITLVVVGQLLIGIVVDHFGLFGREIRVVDGTRLFAALLLITASYLMIK